MFEMFQDMEQKQRELQEKLAEIVIEHSSDDKLIVIMINANKEIRDITISETLLAPDQSEKLQDLLVITINEAISKAEGKAMEALQDQFGNMFPDLGSFGSPFTA